MIGKKGFISIWCVLLSVLFVIDNDRVDSDEIGNCSSSESKKVRTEAGANNNIERLLLRPVKVEKEVVNTSNLKSEDPLCSHGAEQCVDGMTSVLSSERKKLYELEDEYKKLERELIVRDDKKKPGDNEKLKADKKPDKDSTPSLLEKMYPMPNMISRAGSSTAQQHAINDSKGQEAGLSEDLSHRLSKLTESGSLLDLAECFYKLCEYNNALQTYKLITPTDTLLNQYIWVQYQIANCYRNMKKYDLALSEYQRFINQYPNGDLIESAKWYIDDVMWWKAWSEKNSLVSSRMP